VVWLHAGDNWGSVLADSEKYDKVKITICFVWGILFLMCQSNMCRGWSTSSVAEFCPGMNQ
jgi:hypothetical protein